MSADGDPAAVLHRIFGFPAFRGLQEPAVQHVMAGGDALVLMPTGGGKSLCYQLPALCRSGTAIVISPLIALMDDQVAALRQLGVAAAALHSDLDPEAAREASRALASGRLDLLYVSPERLLANGTIGHLRRMEIALIAIDEAHCVSQWGHEFRPEYRGLARLGEDFPRVPRVALTATADPRTRADILAALHMQGASVFAASFHRDSLHLAATPKTAETAQLLRFLRRHTGEAGIVYCGSRIKSERTAERLRAGGFPAIAFHAGLAALEKREALARFRSGEPVIVTATIAFGMGIDRPDVRFVVHLDMPDSPESYYQQIGRAGRDGERADTLLLYGGEDIARARRWLAQSAAPAAQQAIMRERLEAMIAFSETPECRTRTLLAWFGETLGRDCGHCDRCRVPVRTVNALVEAQKVLSAVYRTGGMFGALHIAAVLRGERTEAVLRHRHDRLALFGIGADHPLGFWRSVTRRLLALGALRTEEGKFATLALVPDAARPILRGEQQVLLAEEPAAVPEDRTTRAAGVLPSAAGSTFEALRDWRMRAAKAQAVPPYVIFHDSVLREIAAVRPATIEELGEIKGVGSSKLVRYGREVLAAVRGA